MKNKKKVVKHLKDDIKTFNKEAKEDKQLIKSFKGSKMKKQGYNDRLDEKLGAKNGKKKQSMKDRRDESKGMEKAMDRKAYASVKSMDKGGRKALKAKMAKK